MVEIADLADVGRASRKDAAATRPHPEVTSPGGAPLVPLTAIAAEQWRALGHRTIEPNGYYLADWELAVNASAPGRTGASALGAFSDNPSASMIGLLPSSRSGGPTGFPCPLW